MTVGVFDDEHDLDVRVEAVHVLGFEVVGNREFDAVLPRSKRKVFIDEIFDTTVVVGEASANFLPLSVVEEFEANFYTGSGFAHRCVEDMGGNSTHDFSNFSNRKRMILACSSATVCNS